MIKNKQGFMVGYEIRKGDNLHSKNFPDKHAGESLIPTEEDAWKIASEFDKTAGENVVNIYIKDQNFMPVRNYQEKIIRKYPKEV